ncbi:unnamed protein product, partial [Toxocara canis]|uniref:Phage tail protein n=1 Tax=Toxocara canis TaxID=6265 RepID=A0A183U5X5_TOXCA
MAEFQKAVTLNIAGEVYGFEKGCDQELPGLYGVAQCL